MWRALKFIAVVAVLVAVAVWLADQPGQVSIAWQGYRIDTTVGVMLALVTIVIAVATLVFRFWDTIRRTPGRIAGAWREHRRGRGYKALGRGMVAVAAGDGDEARRHARKAQDLLDDRPMTLLLAAQAAQIDGDESAAGRFFTAMLDERETEFLGVRGLLTQAIKRDDAPAALELAERAYRLKPKSDWVARTLFELQARQGNWLAAERTGDDMVRHRLVAAPEGRHHRAVLAYQLAMESIKENDEAEARARTRRAFNLDSTFVPAAAAYVHDLIADNKLRKARKTIEDLWRHHPHPDLVEPYVTAANATAPLEQVSVIDKLAALNPEHPESRFAQARINLNARLWGGARDHLAALGADGDRPEARVCRMMAELEESENDDLGLARDWYRRAAHAEPDPTWVCDNCGNTAETWTALCGNCHEFDSFRWQSPPHVSDVARVTGATSSLPTQLPPTSPRRALADNSKSTAVTVPAAEG